MRSGTEPRNPKVFPYNFKYLVGSCAAAAWPESGG